MYKRQIIGGLAWLLITLFSESSSLLQSLNDYFDKLYEQFQNLINYFNFDNIHLSDEILEVIQNSTGDFLTTASDWLRNILNNLINFVTSIPSIAICIGITAVSYTHLDVYKRQLVIRAILFSIQFILSAYRKTYVILLLLNYTILAYFMQTREDLKLFKKYFLH